MNNVHCKINKGITLLAVWLKQADAPNFSYIGQLWMYPQIHRKQLQSEKTIICGDLNSNAVWDESDRWWNQTDVVKEPGIYFYSLYHKKHNKSIQNGEMESLQRSCAVSLCC